MTTEHDEVLCAIERRAVAEGVALEDMDAHIADELRVPRDHYIAYLLVWGAIESYRFIHVEPAPRHTQPAGESPADPVANARILRRLWEHAGHIHEAAVHDGDIRAVVREEARDLIAELLGLTEHLLSSNRPNASHVGKETNRD